MNPSADSGFWAMMPHWAWPFIIAGVIGLMIFQAIKASEALAEHFGKWGMKIHTRANRWDRLEATIMRTNDRLDCATAYLVYIANYHHTADVIIAENCPTVAGLLPFRMPFSEFSRRWEDGWRPE